MPKMYINNFNSSSKKYLFKKKKIIKRTFLNHTMILAFPFLFLIRVWL